MRRFCLLGLLIATANASAHFPFFVPDGPNKVKVVFSDSLKPDDKGVPVDKIAATKVYLAVAVPKPLKWTLDKTANCYTFDVPGKGSRIVYGVTDYGVSQRGDSKPAWTRYFPKTIVGDLLSGDQATAGHFVSVELNPVVVDKKLKFEVIVIGKARANAEVTVLVPGNDKPKVVTTDKDGLTPTFDKAGTYGAYTRFVEARTGEQGGKKYEEIRHYATLAVAFDPK
jgi:hypothetical protein